MKKVFKNILLSVLWFEANLVLKLKKPRIVAITGNVGKTSTKDVIFELLASNYFCRKSKKSFNSEIGVPLTILGLPNGWNNPFIWLWNIIRGILTAFSRRYPDWLILEVGADRPGDIEYVSRFIKSDIVVFTKIGEVPVHIEYFDSRDAVIREKSYLIERATEQAAFVLNADDTYTNDKLMSLVGSRRIITYGFDENANIKASNYAINYKTRDGLQVPSGISFAVSSNNKEQIEVYLYGVLGRQYIYPVLAALAIHSLLGNSLNQKINDILRDFRFQAGRMRILDGVKNTIVIDDSYNASPIAVEEALNTLESIKGCKRKIAVLGDMLELGKFSSEAHKSLGKKAASIVDILCTVGFRARGYAEGALLSGMTENNIFQFENALEAGSFIQNIIKEGDVILVKASQTMRLERVVKEIMAEPDKAGELLVRQEKEWEIR